MEGCDEMRHQQTLRVFGTVLVLVLMAGCTRQWSAQCTDAECIEGGLSEFDDSAGAFYPSLDVEGWPCTDTDGFCRGTLLGFEVYLSLTILPGEEDLAEAVISQLYDDLTVVTDLLEPEVLEVLREVPIWIDAEENPESAGFYNNVGRWIGVPSAELYLRHVETSPAFVLHELAHAWHDLALGFDDEDILAAYQNAMDLDLYAASPLGSPHYATTNELEYFAVLTEAWFWLDYDFPSNRAELLSHDPLGAEVVERAWRW
jgi:hypothetical protein